jgi:hypothetical protein
VTERIPFRPEGEKSLKPAPGTVVEVGVKGAGKKLKYCVK